MPRRDIPQTFFETIRQAKARLLETPAVPRVLMWVGGAALIVSWVLLAYLVGALLARIIVVWSF